MVSVPAAATAGPTQLGLRSRAGSPPVRPDVRAGIRRDPLDPSVRRADGVVTETAQLRCPCVTPPIDDEHWFGLTGSTLPIDAIYEWVVRPDCGAIVLFSGTVRDHADGRADVEHLTYEAYEEQVVPRFRAIAEELRRRWPTTGRVALLHRVGRMEVGESSVVAAVSSPHRPEAFEAARFAIDAPKESAPIWKYEVWVDGEDWGTGASDVREPTTVEGG